MILFQYLLRVDLNSRARGYNVHGELFWVTAGGLMLLEVTTRVIESRYMDEEQHRPKGSHVVGMELMVATACFNLPYPSFLALHGAGPGRRRRHSKAGIQVGRYPMPW